MRPGQRKRRICIVNRKVLVLRDLCQHGRCAVSSCFSKAWKWWKKVWCSLDYVWYNFSYIGRSFSYVRCGFRGIWERLLIMRFASFVGAYRIRPVRHRMNRITNRRHDIAKLAHFGRMQYAPTAMRFTGWLCAEWQCYIPWPLKQKKESEAAFRIPFLQQLCFLFLFSGASAWMSEN